MIPYLKKIAWGTYARVAWDKNRTPSTFFSVIQDKIQTYPKPLQILDAGCGTGIHAQALADLQHYVTGIDFSRSMIQLARRRIHEGNKKYLDFQVLDLNKKLPFPDEHFDVILNISVLQNTANPLECLKELNRITKVEGKIFLVHYPPYLKDQRVHEEVQLKFAQAKDKSRLGKIFLYLKTLLERAGHTRYWTDKEVLDLLIQAGFQQMRVLQTDPIIIMGQK